MYKVMVLYRFASEYTEVYRGSHENCEEVATYYEEDEGVNYADICEIEADE